MPERPEVDHGSVSDKSLNKSEYFRELKEREAQKAAEQRQAEALAEQVNAQQSWVTGPRQKLFRRLK